MVRPLGFFDGSNNHQDHEHVNQVNTGLPVIIDRDALDNQRTFQQDGEVYYVLDDESDESDESDEAFEHYIFYQEHEHALAYIHEDLAFRQAGSEISEEQHNAAIFALNTLLNERAHEGTTIENYRVVLETCVENALSSNRHQFNRA